jgi:hypothetical protein
MRFSAAQKAGILAEARAHLAKPANLGERTSSSPRQSEVVYKTKHDAAVGSSPARPPSAAVASGSSELWWQWVDKRIDASLEAAAEGMGGVLGEFHDEAMREIAALKRELELTRDEVRVLREQLGLSRELASLRADVEQARSEVPKLPAIAARLEKDQARLRRDLERTQRRVSLARADQTTVNYKLNELRKQSVARAASVEMKFETTVSSFKLHELHPDAAAGLRNFATESLKSRWPAHCTETLWVIDPNPRAYGSSNAA